MRVALIRGHDGTPNTRQPESVRRRAGILPSLGLAYIQAALEKGGHQTTLIDCPAEGLSEQGLWDRLQSFGPQLAGVTATTPTFPGALAALRVAKRVGALTVLGGPHTEIFAAQSLVHPELDFGAVGEGATIMQQLANRLDRGESPAGIPGLVGRDTDGGRAPLLNLQQIGRPFRRDLWHKAYRSPIAPQPMTTMISSRGCPYDCGFCFRDAIGRRVMYRDADDVVAEMGELAEGAGIRHILFYDDVFTLKKSRIRELCERILDAGIRVSWEAPTRVDLVDEDLLRLMASAGCRRLRFGLESGSPKILAAMGKHTDLATVHRALAAAKEAGMETFGYFIVGYLDEDERDFAATLALAADSNIDLAGFYVATPLPGTRLHDAAVAQQLLAPDYWQRFVMGEDVGRAPFLAPNADERCRIAYRTFYSRPKRVFRLLGRALRNGAMVEVGSGLASLSRWRWSTYHA